MRALSKQSDTLSLSAATNYCYNFSEERNGHEILARICVNKEKTNKHLTHEISLSLSIFDLMDQLKNVMHQSYCIIFITPTYTPLEAVEWM